MQAEQSRNLSGRTKIVLLSLILLLHLFVLTPVAIVLGNIEEISTPPLLILQLALVPALAILLVQIAISALLGFESRRRYGALLAITGILIWLQGNVLLWNYGPLDGRSINWEQDPWRGCLDSLIWLVAVAVSVIFYRRLETSLFKLACIVFSIHLISAAWTITSSWQQWQERAADYAHNSSLDYQSFSTTQNVLHIVLDGFQADILQDLLEKNVDTGYYGRVFEGFTYYVEALGVFPYTQSALPNFLSGNNYRNDLGKEGFLNTTMAGKTIINAAHDRGFEVDLVVGSAYVSNKLSKGQAKNSIDINSIEAGGGPIADAASVLDLSLFRVVPHFVKPIIYNEQKWIISRLFKSNDAFGFNYFIHTRFINNWTRSIKVDRANPVYKYLHVLNTHRPMIVTSTCGFSGRLLPDTRTNLLNQSKCTMDTVAKFLERMKAMDIYDDSLILIHADHGGWVPNRRSGQPIIFSNGVAAPSFVASLASPLLMIKPPGASGNLMLSSSLVSLSDIPDTIADIMNWNIDFGHQSVRDIAEGQSRVRRYHYYDWRPDEWDRGYTGAIREFVIDGSHYDVAWKLGRLFPPPE